MPRKANVPRGTSAFEEWSIDRPKPYKRNARTHSRAQIRKISDSIVAFGFNAPILVDRRGGIIAGHGRIEAARLLKRKTVPVVRLDHLTPVQARAYMLADNRLALDAGWDEEALIAELREIASEKVDLSLTGFEEAEIQRLLGSTHAPEDLDEAPEPAKGPPITKLGDLWLLGEHRLLCGDATKAEDVHRLMDGRLADCVWTDPPYGVSYEGKAGKIQNDDLDREQIEAFTRSAMKNAITVTSPGGGVYVAHASMVAVAVAVAVETAGWKVAQFLVWAKSSFTVGRSDYQWQHEPILYGWKPGAAHRWFGGRSQGSLMHFDKPSANRDHPTMKPVGLVEQCIRNSCKRLGLVLDPFGGSGTTLIAAQNSDRVARLLEIDPKYCDVIVKRWETLTGGKAVLEGAGKKPQRHKAKT